MADSKNPLFVSEDKWMTLRKDYFHHSAQRGYYGDEKLLDEN